MKMSKDKIILIVTGLIVGIAAVVLTANGNPGNMGFCIACFIRDISGALKLHSAGAVQYIRPEIIGLVLGSFIISLAKGEFKPRGGSSPMLRFMIAFCVMVGALVFLGCPLRMVLRLAAGDLNALVGLIGFACGIGIGCVFLNNGFSLGKAYKQHTLEGLALPAINVGLLILLTAGSSLVVFSTTGPGSKHAPIILALGIGLIVGAFAQRSRMCFAGGIRDTILLKDVTLLTGFIGVFVAALIGNLIAGSFNLGFTGQPIAHAQHIWNFLGMLVVGLGSVMLGGCPLRQLILAGEGNSDSSIAVLGYAVGAAFAHNFSLASSAASADSLGGPGTNGKVAVFICLAFLLVVACIKTFAKKEN